MVMLVFGYRNGEYLNLSLMVQINRFVEEG